MTILYFVTVVHLVKRRRHRETTTPKQSHRWRRRRRLQQPLVSVLSEIDSIVTLMVSVQMNNCLIYKKQGAGNDFKSIKGQ